MAHVSVHEEVELDTPTFVEGLPGVGLVGKIAADHLVSTFDMTYHAGVHCHGLPKVAVYREGDRMLRPPVRLYADAERDLVVLQSDVPVSPSESEEFASCITGWFHEHDVTPVFISGVPVQEPPELPSLFGVATGDGGAILDEHGIGAPSEMGLVSGPTGALLYQAGESGLSSVGLITEASAQFPDPAAAKVVLDQGVEPITGLDIPTDQLVEQAEEIRAARERLAQRMQQATTDEASQAQPMRGFQ